MKTISTQELFSGIEPAKVNLALRISHNAIRALMTAVHFVATIGKLPPTGLNVSGPYLLLVVLLKQTISSLTLFVNPFNKIYLNKRLQMPIIKFKSARLHRG